MGKRIITVESWRIIKDRRENNYDKLRLRILIRLSQGRNIIPLKERENFYCYEEKEEIFTVKSWKDHQRSSNRGLNFRS